MMRTILSLCITAICSVAFGADLYIKKADIPYMPNGGARQQLDLYLPLDYEKRSKPLPVICFIHGGGWVGGSKDRASFAADQFVSKGYAVAGITYRFAPQNQMPAQIIDCKAAVRWLRANAKTYNLDPQRFASWGSSAGGHLAAFLGVCQTREFDQGENLDQTSTVCAVVDYFGPSNLLTGYINDPKAAARNKRIFGESFEEKKDLLKSSSPIYHVTKESSPMLIIHAVDDVTVPIAQSRELYDVLQKAGVESELVEMPKNGHNFTALSTQENLEKITLFFEKHLK